MAFPKYQQMVQAFTPDRPDEAFTDSIRSGCFDGGGNDVDVSTGSDRCKMRPILVIIVADQMLGTLIERRCFAQLLGRPGIGRMAGNTHMNHAPRAEFHDHEGKQRPEEDVRDLDKITGPDGFRLIMQETQPRLFPWLSGGTCRMYLRMVRLLTRTPSFSSSP